MTESSWLPERATKLRGRSRELDVLHRLVEAVRAGESQVLVVSGEPGVGKTELLNYVAGHAPGCRVARAAGVQSEMELAFAGLHQLCAPMLDRLDGLPTPQREALRTVFGISQGPPPDRFLVGLSVLGLLSEVAGDRPLICLVDDEQWLDRASAQALQFVARRLGAEPVGLLFATRREQAEAGPELVVEGLGNEDARALLESVFTGSLDAQVRDLIVAETRGNPLALLELPKGLTSAQLAGGFGLPGAMALPGRIERGFRRRITDLPGDTRRLLQIAAADPSGDPVLVWRAAGRLGIDVQAAALATEAGLVEFGARVRFRHPLVRSAAYRSASRQGTRDVHQALAEATDPAVDPDRRAWHRAQAAPGPDEDIAAELEHSADRAQGRGGLAAAAAFLERAALLTPNRDRRTRRLLAAARAKQQSGAPEAALELLDAVEAGPLDARQIAEVERLRGQTAFDQGRAGDSAWLLLSAARLLQPVDISLARETYLEALWLGLRVGGDVRQETAEAARVTPPGPDLPRAVDALLDASALLLTEGYTAAGPALTQAVELVLALGFSTGEDRRWLVWESAIQAAYLQFDLESAYALAAGQARVARDMGALTHLRVAISFMAIADLLRGELVEAVRLVEEDDLIAETMGTLSFPYLAVMLAAWQGQEARATGLIDATVRAGKVSGLQVFVDGAIYASSVLSNGLGRHDDALAAAWPVFERDTVLYGHMIVGEVAEAAFRTGNKPVLEAVLRWLSERTRTTPNNWSLGIEARIRAFLSDGDAADSYYQKSIEHLGHSMLRAELARAHLVYGEWLRRERRRMEARKQLHMAQDMLETMGIGAFADRARRELASTGEAVRKRTVETLNDLTVQEMQVARLALDGMSNPEIGARLFISRRTVQYHLSNVFTKLGISSRSQLHLVLPKDSAIASSP
jgi:DNA-binding CsgD family transcriptional regulator